MGTTGINTKQHPEYVALSQEWSFYLDSYLAPLDYYASKYLSKYYKEGPEAFSERQGRAYRENHSKRIVDMINGYLFKEPPTRKISNKLMDRFIKNADGKGNSLDSFMKGVSMYSSICGRVYVVVDKRDAETITGTQLDNLKSDVYCYTVLPQNVLDIAFDDWGNVKWAIVREVRRNDDDPFTADTEHKEFYRLWQKGGWTLYDENGVEADSGETGMDFVPIFAVDNEEHPSNYTGQSLISDIAYLDKAVFNNWSRLDVIVNDQTFSQLIFPMEGLAIPEIVTDEELREQFLSRSTDGVLFFGGGKDAVRPEYISPDASQAEFILKMIKYQTSQIYASMGVQSEVATNNGSDRQSGISKAYDFDRINKLLANKADNLEQAERKIFQAFKAWLNIEDEIEIDYPEEFDVKSLSQEILFAQELSVMDISHTFNKELLKTLALKALPKLSEELKDKILKEIEEKTPEEMALKQAVFGFDKNANETRESNEKIVGGKLAQGQNVSSQYK